MSTITHPNLLYHRTLYDSYSPYLTCIYVHIVTGHLSYTGFVLVDSIHNNPVMNVFIYLLCVTAEAKSTSSREQEFQDSSGRYYGHVITNHVMICCCSGIDSSQEDHHHQIL